MNNWRTSNFSQNKKIQKGKKYVITAENIVFKNFDVMTMSVRRKPSEYGQKR